jgi:hypothetical protein
LEEIENENIKIIENNRDSKLDFNLENINQKSIDQLYAEIISYLINFELKNPNKIFDIFKKLNLEKIELTRIMLEEINKQFKEDYKLKKVNDLFNNEEIINYYYILLKYLYKNDKYLEMNYFLDSKKFILNSIDSIFKSLDKNCELEKFVFIINKFTDNKYQRKINEILYKDDNDNNFDYNNLYRNDEKEYYSDKFEDNIRTESNKDDIESTNNENIIRDLNNTTTKVINEDYNKIINSKNFETKLKVISQVVCVEFLKIQSEKKSPDNIDFLTLIKKIDKNDSLLEYVELKNIKLKKLDFLSYLGYTIQNGVIAFIKNYDDKYDLLNIYSHIIDYLNNNSYDEEICKTIFEIPKMNNIFKLTLFSKKLLFI